MNGLEERLADVRRRLETAAGDRWPVPKLIAVTKTHPAEMILPLEKLGIADIGENRVQEITAKLPQLEGHFQIHLIGRLQTNKVKYIIDHVCMIQSVDRMELAAAEGATMVRVGSAIFGPRDYGPVQTEESK